MFKSFRLGKFGKRWNDKKFSWTIAQSQNIYTGGASRESPDHVYNVLCTIVHIF